MQNLYFKIFYRGRYFQKLLWCFKLVFAIIINKFLYQYKEKYSTAWIIGTGDDRYENNVRTFYEYMKYKHPSVIIYWIADKKERIPIDAAMIIKRGTIKNYLLALNASVGLYSHSDADIAPGIFRLIKKRKTKIIHLDHGQSGFKSMKHGFWDDLVFDAMCCFSDYEREVKIECGVSKEKLFTTGYAHSDDYDIVPTDTPIKHILIMPTWREFYINGDKVFENTTLYDVYKSFFNDKLFKTLCKDRGISVTFVLHPTFDNYYHTNPKTLKYEYGDWINVITDGKGDIHEEINSSDMLITDYSSLLWDFIYMNKPVLIYGFDWDEYNAKRGIRIPKEKVGKCLCEKQEILISRIEKIIEGNHNFGQKEMIENFFTYVDKHNCDRIYNVITKLIEK